MLIIQSFKNLNENGQVILVFPSRLENHAEITVHKNNDCKLLMKEKTVLGKITYIAQKRDACIYQFTAEPI